MIGEGANDRFAAANRGRAARRGRGATRAIPAALPRAANFAAVGRGLNNNGNEIVLARQLHVARLARLSTEVSKMRWETRADFVVLCV